MGLDVDAFGYCLCFSHNLSKILDLGFLVQDNGSIISPAIGAYSVENFIDLVVFDVGVEVGVGGRCFLCLCLFVFGMNGEGVGLLWLMSVGTGCADGCGGCFVEGWKIVFFNFHLNINDY